MNTEKFAAYLKHTHISHKKYDVSVCKASTHAHVSGFKYFHTHKHKTSPNLIFGPMQTKPKFKGTTFVFKIEILSN